MLVEQRLNLGEDCHFQAASTTKSTRGPKSKEVKGKLIGALKKLDSKLLKFLQKNQSKLPPQERVLLKGGTQGSQRVPSSSHTCSGHTLTSSQPQVVYTQYTSPGSADMHQAYSFCNLLNQPIVQPTHCTYGSLAPCNCGPNGQATLGNIQPSQFIPHVEPLLMLPKGLERRKTLAPAKNTSHQRSGSSKTQKTHRRKSSQNIHIHQHVHCHHGNPFAQVAPHQRSVHSVLVQKPQIDSRLTPKKSSIDSNSLHSLHRRFSSHTPAGNTTPPPQQAWKQIGSSINYPGMHAGKPNLLHFGKPSATPAHLPSKWVFCEPGVPFVHLDLSRPWQPCIPASGAVMCKSAQGKRAIQQQQGMGKTDRAVDKQGNRRIKAGTDKRAGLDRDGKGSRGRESSAKEVTGRRDSMAGNGKSQMERQTNSRHQASVGSRAYESMQSELRHDQKQRQAAYYRDTDAASEGEDDLDNVQAYLDQQGSQDQEFEPHDQLRHSQEPYHTMQAIESFSSASREGRAVQQILPEASPYSFPEQSRPQEHNYSSTWSGGFSTYGQKKSGPIPIMIAQGKQMKSRIMVKDCHDDQKENIQQNQHPNLPYSKIHRRPADQIEEHLKQVTDRTTKIQANRGCESERYQELRDFAAQSPLLQVHNENGNATTKRISSRNGSVCHNRKQSFGLQAENLVNYQEQHHQRSQKPLESHFSTDYAH